MTSRQAYVFIRRQNLVSRLHGFSDQAAWALAVDVWQDLPGEAPIDPRIRELGLVPEIVNIKLTAKEAVQ